MLTLRLGIRHAQVFETIACDEAVPGSLESIQLPCAEEDLAFEVEDGAWKAVSRFEIRKS